jgi:NH3-dependent NAD+ synthetase
MSDEWDISLDALSDEELTRLEDQLDDLLDVADESWDVVKEIVGQDADNPVVAGVSGAVDSSSDAAVAVQDELSRRGESE